MFSSTSRMEQLERRNFSRLHNVVLGQVLGDLESELQTPGGRKAVNCVDSEGVSPLIWAARRGDLFAVDTLIRYGAAVSHAQLTGATALYYASISSSHDGPHVVRSLLKAGAPVNARSVRGETPLHLCVLYKDDPENFIAPMVEHGADIYACDGRDISILDAAIQSDHANNVAFLLEMGVPLNRPSQHLITGLPAAIINDSHRVLRLLMEHGADTSVVSKEQKTLLHLAAGYADSKTMEILTEYGLNVAKEAKDASGYTAEEIFAKREDKDAAMIDVFGRLVGNLVSGAVVFADIDEKDVTVIDLSFEHKIEVDSDTEGEQFFDVEEHP